LRVPPSPSFPYTALFRSQSGAGATWTPAARQPAGGAARSAHGVPAVVSRLRRGGAVPVWAARRAPRQLAVGREPRARREQQELRSEEHTSELQSLAYLVC